MEISVFFIFIFSDYKIFWYFIVYILGHGFYKWPLQTQKDYHGVYFTGPDPLLVEGFKSPPYLIAEPDIKSHKILDNDCFIVLASDGLTNKTNDYYIVNEVGNELKLREVKKQLYSNISEQKLSSSKNTDNFATILARSALKKRKDHTLVQSSEVPYSENENYRDDISVLVVLFNRDKIGNIEEVGTVSENILPI